MWQQDYSRFLRSAANWELNDIISMRIWIAHPDQFPAESSVSRHPVRAVRKCDDTRNCVAILSKELHYAGCRIFCQFYRNGKRVHLPMRSTVERSLRVVLHFVELTDQIQIVKPIKLEDVPIPKRIDRDPTVTTQKHQDPDAELKRRKSL